MSTDPLKYPSRGEAFWVWLKIAALSFGGPAGQIAVMHRILVQEKRWLSDQRFLHALNFCMLLPGPEAQQLATYIGWLMHRTVGGLIAGLLFIAPGALAIGILSAIYAQYGELDWVTGVFFGLKVAVLVIVVQAVQRVGSRALGSLSMGLIAAAAFIAIFVFGIPFPIIIVAAGLLGYLGNRFDWPGFSKAGQHHKTSDEVAEHETVLGRASTTDQPVAWRPMLLVATVLMALWLIPTLTLVMILGPSDVYSQIAVFFSKMAVVTFGGAYAVLAYVAQAAVDNFGWLAPGEMLDGLGLAETTPGPLIMVTQFVGYLAAFRDPGAMPAWQAGLFGAALTTWVTFVPCFIWIFIGAPFVERLRSNEKLSAILTAITAAVVGVILNLAVWFALHVLFGRVFVVDALGMNLSVPDLTTARPVAWLMFAVAIFASWRLGIGPARLLAGAAIVGFVLSLLITLPA